MRKVLIYHEFKASLEKDLYYANGNELTPQEMMILLKDLITIVDKSIKYETLTNNKHYKIE